MVHWSWSISSSLRKGGRRERERERSNCNSGEESQQVGELGKIRAGEWGVVTTSAVQCGAVEYNKIGRARIDLYLIGLWDYWYNIYLTLCSRFLFNYKDNRRCFVVTFQHLQIILSQLSFYWYIWRGDVPVGYSCYFPWSWVTLPMQCVLTYINSFSVEHPIISLYKYYEFVNYVHI